MDFYIRRALLVILCTVPTYQASLKFLLLADWGGVPFFPYKTLVEMNVGREMAYLADKQNVDFILALGDNFYLKGVTDVDDKRFEETFESAFNYESLNVPWYVVAGNHDHYGNVSAQIMYSSRSKRWNFPALYYKKSFTVPYSNITIDFIMIDTIVLCGNVDMIEPSQPILETAEERDSEQQWKWLEETLRSSKANYIFVCGHYPVYSVGYHGSTDCLVDRLQPMLHNYSVSAYFSGHDHNMQHIQVQRENFIEDYFIGGSAAFINPSKAHQDKIPPGSLKFHWANPFSFGAFTFAEINENNMTIVYTTSSGKILYSTSKMPRF